MAHANEIVIKETNNRQASKETRIVLVVIEITHMLRICLFKASSNNTW